MDTVYVLAAGGLLLRWLHVITAMAWIGSSLYFVWLDNNIATPSDSRASAQGVAGELWAMHGGGFYHSQKYLNAPAGLPSTLHFFFMPAYATWISGLLLILTLYYLQATLYMVDPAVSTVSPGEAVGIGIAALLIGWLVYDLLAKLLVRRNELWFAVAYLAFFTGAAWILSHVLAGRAAVLHLGAMLATVMSANVFLVIIPNQKKQVAVMTRGESPDPALGIRAKQRSVHNNYLTLPVVLAMISNHYAWMYSHRHAWLIVILMMLGSVLIRHFINLRQKGQLRWGYALAGTVLIVTVLAWAASPSSIRAATLNSTSHDDSLPRSPTASDIETIINMRCVGCHSTRPTLMAAAPAGLKLDRAESIKTHAALIYAQVVQAHVMPLANATHMTDAERAEIAAWFEAGAR